MQNPDTGDLTVLESLDDPKREGKEEWPVYELGERIHFRGFWWEITKITDEGMTIEPRGKLGRLRAQKEKLQDMFDSLEND